MCSSCLAASLSTMSVAKTFEDHIICNVKVTFPCGTNKWYYVQYLESMQGMQCVAGQPDMFPFGPYTYIHLLFPRNGRVVMSVE